MLKEPLAGQPLDELGQGAGWGAVKLMSRPAHHSGDDASVNRAAELALEALHGLADEHIVAR